MACGTRVQADNVLVEVHEGIRPSLPLDGVENLYRMGNGGSAALNDPPPREWTRGAHSRAR